MFQYAFGRAIALRCNYKLVLDTWSGFIRDKQYRRSYALGVFKVQARPATILERLPLWLFKINDKVKKREQNLKIYFCFVNFFLEKKFVFQPKISEDLVAKHNWFVGYWQSPKYFQMFHSEIRKELAPPIPVNKKILALGEIMRCSESVAVGIRLYEESEDPTAHAFLGRSKNPEDISKVINRLLKDIPQVKFFIFCTHRADFLSQIDLPKNSVFVTPEDGYENEIDCMWLLSQCKHHIFTNSSYYWWGAWLSHATHNQDDQLIFAADNFINVDGLCEHWNRF